MANISINSEVERKDKPYLNTSLQQNIFECLEEHGPMTRRELVNKLETARTTIYDNLAKLKKRNIIEKASRNNERVGRPPIYWRIKKTTRG